MQITSVKKHQSRLALGSDTTLMLVGDVPGTEFKRCFDNLWLEIYKFERRFSRFIPDSELSRFNRAAGMKTYTSPEFHDILVVAKKLSQATDGLFNPFILPVLHRVGYRQSFVKAYADDYQDNFAFHSVVTIDKLNIGNDWAMIPYGTAIDLGGCGKGYLADFIVSQLLPDWLQGYWLSFGGDIVGGGTDELGSPWEVSITNGIESKSKKIARLRTTKKPFTIATSGTTVRRGSSNGRDWHHIIDPRTLKPADTTVQMASVAHKSLVWADVIASCLIILGVEKSKAFLKKHSVRNALLVEDDSQDNRITLIGDAITLVRQNKKKDKI